MARSARQNGHVYQAAIKLQLQIQMPKNLSCDWSKQFMKVILIGLSLVRSLQYRSSETGLQYKRTSEQLTPAYNVCTTSERKRRTPGSPCVFSEIFELIN